MCVDQKLSERHAKRRQLAKTRPSRTADRTKLVGSTDRGRINVPLVLAAIAEDVIDALGPKKIRGSRLPKVIDLTPTRATELIAAEIWRRRHEDWQVREQWLAENQFAGLSAA